MLLGPPVQNGRAFFVCKLPAHSVSAAQLCTRTVVAPRICSPCSLPALGLIGLRVDGPRGALVEVNSETDFVARNAKFQEFVKKVLEVALEKARAGAGGAAAEEVPATRELNVVELLQAEHPGL